MQICRKDSFVLKSFKSTDLIKNFFQMWSVKNNIQEVKWNWKRASKANKAEGIQKCC